MSNFVNNPKLSHTSLLVVCAKLADCLSHLRCAYFDNAFNMSNQDLLKAITLCEKSHADLFSLTDELIKENNGWISVDVSLPHPIDLNTDCRNHRNRLQVYYTDVYGVEMVDYAWFVYNSKIEDVGFELCTTGGIVQPTHWQPLPQPPKE